MKTLSRKAIQRMTGSNNTSVVGSGGAGGGSVDLSGYATESWVDENYLSIGFFSSLFKAYDSSSIPNEIVPNGGDTTAITNIKAMFGFWTEQYLSSLGQNSGGGGLSLNEPLSSINNSGLSAPGVSQDGMTLVWDNANSKWKYGSTGGGGGVMQVNTGTGLTGGPITGTGTISINSTYQSYISHGETAYGWGNHANAGYLTGITAAMVNTALGFTLSGTSGATYNLATIATTADHGETAYNSLSNYLPLTGGTLTGALGVSGRLHNSGDDEGIVITPASNDFAGVCLGDYSGRRSVFYLNSTSAFWRYNPDGPHNYDILHPGASGTIALQEWVTSQGYLTGITSPMVTTALGYTPLSNATTFWGQTASGGAVTGSLTSVADITMSGNLTASGTVQATKFYLSSSVYFELDTNGVHLVGAGLYSDSFISALGQGSGGGGGATALTDLVDVAISSPSNGQALVYNATSGKWENQTISTGGGTVMQVNTGTGLTGGPITGTGTISINSTYQSYISHGETAYGWGDHSQAGYATQTWVGQQGFLISSDLNGYATQSWVGDNYLPLSGGTLTGDLRLKNSTNYGMHLYFGDDSYCYLYEDTDDHLKIYGSKGVEITTGSGYNLTWGGNVVATQSWIQSQSYLTGITSPMVTTALGFTPLSNATTFWGQSVSSGAVSGTIEAGNSGGAVSGFYGIELNTHGNQTSNGGYIDFHYSGSSSDYTSRIIEESAGTIRLYGKLKIGSAFIEWDSTNNCLKITGDAVVTGAVTALG